MIELIPVDAKRYVCPECGRPAVFWKACYHYHAVEAYEDARGVLYFGKALDEYEREEPDPIGEEEGYFSCECGWHESFRETARYWENER